MPRPRLSDCERQVPTRDRATVHCFWCGQRGHFWYDKFTSKRCTNQPKLTAVDNAVTFGTTSLPASGAPINPSLPLPLVVALNRDRSQGQRTRRAKRAKSAQQTHIRELWHNSDNSHHALSRTPLQFEDQQSQICVHKCSVWYSKSQSY